MCKGDGTADDKDVMLKTSYYQCDWSVGQLQQAVFRQLHGFTAGMVKPGNAAGIADGRSRHSKSHFHRVRPS